MDCYAAGGDSSYRYTANELRNKEMLTKACKLIADNNGAQKLALESRRMIERNENTGVCKTSRLRGATSTLCSAWDTIDEQTGSRCMM